MSLNNFDIGKLLGKGSFGSVNIVTRKLDKKIYAMKRVNLSHSPKNEIEAALNEIRLLASLDHPNIIGYKETFYDNPSFTLNIVMEFADGGDLSKKIEYNKKHHCLFEENLIWEWIFQLLNGLTYLHGHHIMHRDLKSANVFLMKNGVLKIGDLNVSKLSKNNYARTKTGTPYYLAPEVWDDLPYDYKCDIWSLGCIIYELCTLVPPFRGTNFKQLYTNIKSGKFDPIPNNYSSDLKKIINWMLVTNPNNRLSANDLLNSEIVQNRIKSNSRKYIIDKISKSTKHYNLIGTIKMPRNLKDINRVLPHERYQMGENDPYETMKKTIKLMVNKNENPNNNMNNVNIQPLNNYNRDLANQRKQNQNVFINNNVNLNNINQNNINQNNINQNNIKPIIIKDEENVNKREYGIFNGGALNNNNHNFNNNNYNINNNEPKKVNNSIRQNNQKISNKEIKNNNNESKKALNNENKQMGSSTKKKKEKEIFNQINKEFKNNRPQSNRRKLPNGQGKQNESKQRRLPSGQPRNNYNNSKNNNKIDNNNNYKNQNYINYNNINNSNNNKNIYGNNNNKNIYGNNNNNNYNHNNKNIKRPSSQYNNRIQVKNIQNNNYQNKNNGYNNNQNYPIKKFEIKNHNYNYNGQNFNMRPYKKENKANYGKIDVNKYKQNNQYKFNNYIKNGGRNNNNGYNKQVNAAHRRANSGIKQNVIHRDGRYRK